MTQLLHTDPLKILVVEDNYGDFLLLKETVWLSKIPVESIELAENIEAAIEYLKDHQPDIVLLDLYLTDSVGLESFTSISDLVQESAVIILSGLSDQKISLEAIALGAQDYLAKGEFDEKILGRTIFYSLERKRNLEKIRQANERYSLVTKATHDMIWDWDLISGKIYRDEHGVINVYGFSSNLAIENSDDWSARIHPDDANCLKIAIQKIRFSGQEDFFELEYRFLDEAGEFRYILDRGYVVRDKAGKALRLIGAAQNVTDQKKAKLALENSEKRFRSLIENSSDGISLIAADKVVMDISHSVSRILGYDKKTYVGVDRSSLIHPDDRHIVDGSFEKAIENPQEISTIQYRFMRADGNYAWIESTFNNQLADPAVNAIVLNFREITDRKKQEEALAKQEALFRVLVERSPDMKILLSEEGKVIFATSAITHLLGYSMEEYLGIYETEIVHPDDQILLAGEIGRILVDPGFVSRVQVRILHKDGHYIWCDKVITNLLHDEHVEAIVCNFWDITKEKEAEDKIRESEEKYRSIFNDNPFPMFLYDMETFRILECNQATIETYGYAREEIQGMTVADLLPPGHENDLNPFSEQPEGLSSLAKKVWRHQKKNKDLIDVEVFIYPIEYAGKKVRQAQVNDVTEKLRLAAALENSRLEQQRAVTQATIRGQENEREQLGIELHDNVNQILATSKLYLDFAMSGPEVNKEILEKSKEYIVMATEEIRRLSRLLVPPSLEEFGLTSALDDLIANMGLAARLQIYSNWKKFNEDSFEDDIKLTIYRIVQEQLNNIIKHAEAETVFASLEPTGPEKEGWILTVKDDGKGFDTKTKKNGVGLRNIKSRAELSGGVVEIISEPGKGCELRVFFPLNS